jgi:DNA invertase Pin-like site-specific DNA recombinase
MPERKGEVMFIGYARVSTQDQHLDLQQDALRQAGCTKIIVDRVSGRVPERPGLAQLKEILRADDTLVVWRLDRLGRSLKDLIAWVAWLEQEGIGLRSLHEALDTTTPSGKLTFHIFGALAEFERQLIQERTQAGLRVARARGRLGGRPKALPADKQQLAVQLYQEKKIAVKQICALMGISKPTLYAYVRQTQ